MCWIHSIPISGHKIIFVITQSIQFMLLQILIIHEGSHLPVWTQGLHPTCEWWLLLGRKIFRFWLSPYLICKWMHKADLSSLRLVCSLSSRIPHLYTAIQHSRGVRFPDQNNSGPSNYWVNFVCCFHWGNGAHREQWSALRYNEGHSHQDICFFGLIRRWKNIYPEL